MKKVIDKMLALGYEYDTFESYSGYYVFYSMEWGTKITFKTQREIMEWANNVVID